jgi:hypothetical protein
MDGTVTLIQFIKILLLVLNHSIGIILKCKQSYPIFCIGAGFVRSCFVSEPEIAVTCSIVSVDFVEVSLRPIAT